MNDLNEILKAHYSLINNLEILRLTPDDIDRLADYFIHETLDKVGPYGTTVSCKNTRTGATLVYTLDPMR